MSKKKGSSARGDYEVGYGKPPKHTQFKVVTAIILVGGVLVKIGDINIGNGRRDNENK
jgi:hypothetical protein|tara:strand:+ start:767 stop:940 length:174 start_codon:yes stop_codon:yes gene_type:complete